MNNISPFSSTSSFLVVGDHTSNSFSSTSRSSSSRYSIHLDPSKQDLVNRISNMVNAFEVRNPPLAKNIYDIFLERKQSIKNILIYRTNSLENAYQKINLEVQSYTENKQFWLNPAWINFAQNFENRWKGLFVDLEENINIQAKKAVIGSDDITATLSKWEKLLNEKQIQVGIFGEECPIIKNMHDTMALLNEAAEQVQTILVYTLKKISKCEAWYVVTNKELALNIEELKKLHKQVESISRALKIDIKGEPLKIDANEQLSVELLPTKEYCSELRHNTAQALDALKVKKTKFTDLYIETILIYIAHIELAPEAFKDKKLLADYNEDNREQYYHGKSLKWKSIPPKDNERGSNSTKNSEYAYNHYKGREMIEKLKHSKHAFLSTIIEGRSLIPQEKIATTTFVKAKKIWRNLMFKNHPDKNKTEQATKNTQELNEAREEFEKKLSTDLKKHITLAMEEILVQIDEKILYSALSNELSKRSHIPCTRL